MPRMIEMRIEVALADGADPDQASDAVFDLLCSVGENNDAAQAVDAFVQSFDGMEWKERDT